MRIPPQALAEFQELYKEELGEEISLEEAERQGQDIIQLLSILLKK